MTKTISPEALRHHWRNRLEIALLDVREEGPFSNAHPFWAVTLPVSELEVKLPRVVPRLSAPIVVYDDGEGYVDRAVERISAMGYQDVAILEGGLSAYARVGEVFRDVSAPSKSFGELVEAIRDTPSLHATEIKKIIDNEDDVVVLDTRRYDEYNTMSIPRGQSCPGGELLYRIFEAAPSPDTQVIVHCAGRTRSIIGTQSLVNSRIPRKVVALRDGTIGWSLAGYQLEHEKELRVSTPSKEAVRKAREYAGSWAEYCGVSVINVEQLKKLAAEAETRTLYMFDVRDPGEYAAGHAPGFSLAPGGQLVQGTDEWVAVRGARIVLKDTDGVRARMAATWLLQLGWEVYVLDENETVPADLPRAKQASVKAPCKGAVTVEQLQTLRDATIVDLGRSRGYQKQGHIPGAWFASGPELVRDLENKNIGAGPIVLTSPDGAIAAANVEYASKALSREVLYLVGGTDAWVKAGGSLEKEPRWLSTPVDVYKKPYEGNFHAYEAMQGYIDWEHGLVAQLAQDNVACFHVIRDNRPPVAAA